MAYASALRQCPTCWGYETRECLSGRHPRRCPKCLPDQCCPIWPQRSPKGGDARDPRMELVLTDR
jgi:hypothetical protein